MMVSPPSNYDLNLVSYPFTPFPEVKIKPDPLISGNTVILSFILNLYWNIDSISGYYYFFFEICLIPFPLSLNLSLLNFIYMFFLFIICDLLLNTGIFGNIIRKENHWNLLETHRVKYRFYKLQCKNFMVQIHCQVKAYL